MAQKLRFGLVLGRLAILKKNIWVDYEQLLGELFIMFSWSKKKLDLKKNYYSVHTKKLQIMKVKKIFKK
jgi:hypothetical protein